MARNRQIKLDELLEATEWDLNRGRIRQEDRERTKAVLEFARRSGVTTTSDVPKLSDSNKPANKAALDGYLEAIERYLHSGRIPQEDRERTKAVLEFARRSGVTTTSNVLKLSDCNQLAEATATA